MLDLNATRHKRTHHSIKTRMSRMACLVVTCGLLLGCAAVLGAPEGNLKAARSAATDANETHIVPISVARHYTLDLQTAYLEREASLRDARTHLGLATLATGAVTLFYAITGRAHQDFITGSAIGTAALYAGSDIITDRLKQEVYANGARALGCVFQGYSQVGILDDEVDAFLTGDESFNKLIEDLNEALGAVENDDTFRNANEQLMTAALTTRDAANERRRQALDYQRFSDSAGDLMLMQARSIEAKVGGLLRDVAQDPLKVARSSTEVAANRARFAPSPATSTPAMTALTNALTQTETPDQQTIDKLWEAIGKPTRADQIESATNDLAQIVSKWDETIGHTTSKQSFQPPVCDPAKPAPSKAITINPPEITIPAGTDTNTVFRALVTGTEGATGTFWMERLPTELTPVLENSGILSVTVTSDIAGIEGETFTLGIRELSGHERTEDLTIKIGKD
ncbi:MAG: hypothetical protein P1U69_15510 [Parvibaculaceae bacterium]|nr:hypothetical protein [Parvibaculaceae bacterium]HBM87192.1 hypothetical protein [Rhodobiaceae bacterium]